MDRARRASHGDELRRRDRARPRMDRRPAEPERRLGRVRRRQLEYLSQQHSVRRPRRAARSADRGRHRALRLDAGAARRDRADQQGRSPTASTICAGPSWPTGSWYGRWGLNYIYGTWSVLCALNAAGVDHEDPDDAQGGGLAGLDPERGRRLGRGCGRATGSTTSGYEAAPSTASQTAWAVLGLMAAGEVEHPAVARGIEYLMGTQTEKGCGTSSATRRPAFRGCSICAITATRSSFRSGRWRAIAT